MAFKVRDLSVLAFANGFTLWHYRTSDALHEVTAPGYWDTSRDALRVGDHLHVTAGSGNVVKGTLLCVRYQVPGNVVVERCY